MLIVKCIILIMLLFSSSYTGILIARKYQNRVIELREMKTLLSALATKIKLTYEPLPEIFKQLGERNKSNVGNIFKNASKNMLEISAKEAWINALNTKNINLNNEDIDILKNLGNLLGKVDVLGQINEIELVNNFLNSQIEKAEEECKKNQKMYKTLGITIGLAMVIIFI